MDKLSKWFTASRRSRLYAALMALLGLLVVHGVLTADDVTGIGIVLVNILGIGGLSLAKRNLTPDE